METISKQTWEQFTIWGNFAKPGEDMVGLDTDENLDATKISNPPNAPDDGGEPATYFNHTIALDRNGNDATSEFLDPDTLTIDGQRLGVRIIEGDEAKSPYKVTFRGVSETGERFEIDLKVKIKNR